MKQLKMLALSGSLRRDSYNSAALRALQLLAPAAIDIRVGDIGGLPLFNPDREDEAIAAVAELKADLALCDGLVIASPEYAHGISGPMKNALDWLVSGTEFPSKPIMLINTSPRAHHALDALKEVLATMSGTLFEEAFVSIPLLGSGLDSATIATDSLCAEQLCRGLQAFAAAIRTLQSG
ncbi:NAD(P)H-dependent oxidoreductase [Microbulbifer sp. SAOS-129_SWC]|uniref:NADPH-dependent FMN reductase n=1 Tax=Microbulbifer sp. SAOS-129_SWC TaxID=3145235 RepID=UPI0032177F34